MSRPKCYVRKVGTHGAEWVACDAEATRRLAGPRWNAAGPLYAAVEEPKPGRPYIVVLDRATQGEHESITDDE